MPITTKDWQDFPSVATPVTAASLTDLESRVGAYSDTQTATRVGRGELVVDIRDYGAVSDSSTDCTSAIQAAIDAAATQGRSVFIPPAPQGWGISSTLHAQKATRIFGRHSPNYFGAGFRPSFIYTLSGFSDTQMIRVDPALSSSGDASGGSISGVCLYTSDTSGLVFYGAVKDWLVRDLEVSRVATNGYGIIASGNGSNSVQELRMENVHVWGGDAGTLRGQAGVYLIGPVYDCQFDAVVVHHMNGPGWLVGGTARSCGSLEWTNSRSEWNAGDGWSTTSGDKCSWRGCISDRNQGHGLSIAAGAMDRPAVIDGCYFNRDGSTGSKAGIRIADTAKVHISHTTVATGLNDGGGGTLSPAHGIWTSGAGTVVLTQGEFTGVTSGARVDSGSLRYSGGSFVNGTFTAPSTS